MAEGDGGPPAERSLHARAGSGVRARLDSDGEVEPVDERDLLDDAAFMRELGLELSRLVEVPHEPAVTPKPTAPRPKAPRLELPPPGDAEAARAAKRDATPREIARIEVPLHDEAGEATTLPAPPIERGAPVPLVRPSAGASLGMRAALPARERVIDPPLRVVPPPPVGPLPPLPIPPAHLAKVHVDDPLTDAPVMLDAPPTVREGRKRKRERDRPVKLPSYTPGDVTIRTARPSPLPRGKRSTLPWAAALLVVAAVGFAAGKLDWREPASSASAANRSAPMVEVQAPPDDVAARDVEDVDDDLLADDPARAEPPAVVDAVPVETTPPSAPKAEVGELPASAGHPVHRTTAAPEPETIPVAAPPPTKGFDQSAAGATLARAGAKAVSCTDPRGGDGVVSVTFLPDGTSTNVRMNGPYAGTPVAGCVEQIFRGTRVAPFEGSATTVYYTVRLPGDGKPIN